MKWSFAAASPSLAVEWRFDVNGVASVDYRWDGAAFPAGARFAPEMSLAHPLEVDAPGAAETWRYVVDTIAKSERGIEAVVQGQSVTPLFEAATGTGARRYPVKPAARMQGFPTELCHGWRDITPAFVKREITNGAFPRRTVGRRHGRNSTLPCRL